MSSLNPRRKDSTTYSLCLYYGIATHGNAIRQGVGTSPRSFYEILCEWRPSFHSFDVGRRAENTPPNVSERKHELSLSQRERENRATGAGSIWREVMFGDQLNGIWDSADQFRANSGLKAQEYSGPIPGIIFLRFAEVRFIAQRAKLEKASASSRRGSLVDEPAAYHAASILYLVPNARFDFLLNLLEAANIGAKVNDAMRDIEKHNPQLAGVLPKTYNLFTSTLLKELLKKVSEIPATVDYDAFGRIRQQGVAKYNHD